MHERGITLLKDHDWSRSLVGWFCSEKLDGCRAYWDGRQFWTRGGNVIEAPDRILRKMPAGIPVDGEIWAGRGGFQKARVAVENNIWSDEVDFVAFDFPGIAGNWAQRMKTGSRYGLRAVECWAICSMKELEDIFFGITTNGGEGVVMRNPAVLNYERGRTRNCLKIKSWDCLEDF